LPFTHPQPPEESLLDRGGQEAGAAGGQEGGQDTVDTATLIMSWRACSILTKDLSQYNALERDLAVVNLYFGSSSVFGQLSVGELWLTVSPEYQIRKRMTLFDFIASLGGLFGLCLGFSIVSFFEIIFWFSIALCNNIKK
jgi:hypothetical protein